MKKFIIKEGRHRPFSLIPACIKGMCIGDSIIKKKVMFTQSCRYYLNNGDQQDWNKLFGVCFGLFGIHKDSARLVWRYNPQYDVIEIAVYYYKDGTRTFQKVFDVAIGEERTFEMELYHSEGFTYVATFVDECTQLDNERFDKDNYIALGCGLYFGGNQTAPHDIEIKMKKL